MKRRPTLMQRFRAAIVKRRVGVLAAVALTLVAAACGDQNGQVASDGPADSNEVSSASSWGPLAVVPPSDGSDGALIMGTLQLTPECVLLDERGEDVLLVWPADRTKWEPQSGTVSFILGDGRMVMLTDGDEITLGGGGSSVKEDGGLFDDWAASIEWVSEPPTSCGTDTRWFVGEIVASSGLDLSP